MSKNVMVLAMSTLSISSDDNKISASKFAYNESDSEGEEYFSQMEPTSKMILRREGSLDQIIILATKDTKEKKTFLYKDQMKEISAVDFYLERMQIEDKNKVNIVDVEENSMIPAISKTIELIRETKQECEEKDKEKMNLWIDTQGGFRNINLVINAIISLLRDANIEPSGVYSINFNRGKEIQKIIDQTNTYKVFQFVSGINEFTRCGRAEQLEDYYNSINKEIPEDVKTMKEIAESIQMCNIFEFDKHLAKLREWYKKIPETDSELLGIFRNQIRQDYGNLLEDSCTGLDIVEWFYKKKFYQQAITYVEAKLPKEWIKKRIVEYRIEPEVMKKLKTKLSKNYEKDENMVIYQIGLVCSKWNDIMIKTDRGPKPVTSFVDERSLKRGRRDIYYNNEKNLDIPVEYKYKKDGKRKTEVLGTLEITANSKLEKVLDMLLLYKLLKNERNNFNHMVANKPRADQETLGKAIKLFINLGREVYEAK